MKFFLFILQISLLLPHLAISQKAFEFPPKVDVNYFTKFDNYTIKQGLSSNHISKIIQDNNGFLWLATNDGLNRFDGYKFIVFKNDLKDTNSISDNNITSLAVDIFNNLWFGTKNGLNKIDLTTYKVTRYYHSESNKNSLADNWVRALFADKEGFLFIETTEGTFHKYDIKKNTFKFFKHSGGESNYAMHNIYQDKDGIIWIGGSTTRGLIKFNTKNDILTERIFNNGNSFCTFLEDKHNNFFVGSPGAKIHLLDKSILNFKEIPLSSVYKIIEDENGDIWFGGYSIGALKYNVIENKLTSYKHNSDNPHSIIADQVLDIFQDKSGCIWFGTKLGLSKLSFKKYKFDHYFHMSGTGKSVSSNRIYSCANDNDSVVWLGTNDNGLDEFNRNTGTFQNFKYGKDKTGIASNQVTGIGVSKNKNDLWISLWNGFEGGALNKFDKRKKTFTRYNVGDKWLSNVFIDSKENVWTLGWGWGTGLTLFNKIKGEPDSIHFSKNTVPWSINYLKADNNNLLWFGNGFYNLKNNQFYSIVPFYKKEENYNLNVKRFERIPNYIVLKDPPVAFSQLVSMIVDKHGNNWLCYDNGTLMKYISGTKTFDYFSINEDILTASAEKNNNFWIATKNRILLYNPYLNKKEIILNIGDVKTLCEDNYNNLWLASDKSVYKYNCITKQLKTVLTVSNSYISLSEDKEFIVVCSNECIYKINCKSLFKELISDKNFIKSINNVSINSTHFLKNETIFIGTNKGLFLFNIKNRETIKYTHDEKTENSISGNNVMSIESDEFGNIWIGTDKGLCRFNYKDEKFVNLNAANKNSLSSGQTTCALEDKNGNIWVGTSNAGLNLIKTADKTVQHFYNYTYDTTSISDKNISCIFQDSKGIVWIGTEKGLNKFDANNNTFKHYTVNNGFPDDAISGILEDSFYNLWISTGKGLVKFNISTASVEIYTRADGLQDDEFSEACCKFKSGEMLFGGFNGFNIFNPDSIKKNDYLPPVSITALLINNVLINYTQYRNSLVELPYSKNNISFEFSAFDYNSPENNKYLYILEGFDEKWNVSDFSQRIAKYTNIPEGKYKFKLKATNSDGVWNNKELNINIVISPPWWRTWWMYALYILLLASGVLCLIWWNGRRLRQKAKELTEEVRKATKEIVEQKKIVEEKNKDITDSINYAKRIQRAMLPHRKDIWAAFPKSFVLFKPKDIVSGDFYFFQKKEQTVFLAAVDCTGHGVPGAFMSMVGSERLTDAVSESSETSEILLLLNNGIKTSLKQSESDRSTRDGMDIAICSIDTENCIIKFAGANRPLWIIRKGQTIVEEIKATKKAIGGITEDNQHFDSHEIKLQLGDTFYICTDGYADQFNGKDGKKIMTKKFKEILLDIQGKTMQEQEKYLNNFVEKWKAGSEQTDDILVIGVRL